MFGPFFEAPRAFVPSWVKALSIDWSPESSEEYRYSCYLHWGDRRCTHVMAGSVQEAFTGAVKTAGKERREAEMDRDLAEAEFGPIFGAAA